MNVLPTSLARSLQLKSLQNETSQRFLEILARGAIRYCVKNKIDIPKTYDEFYRGIVLEASRKGMNGSFLLQNQKEIDAIYRLFGTNCLMSEDLRKLAVVKSIETLPLEKMEALQTFGGKFNELAVAFGSGLCHNSLVFNKMQELLLSGELSIISEEEGIVNEKSDLIDPELLRLASNLTRLSTSA